MPIPKQLLERLSEFVNANLGLYFPEENWSLLKHRTRFALREYGKNKLEPGIHWLLSSHLNKKQLEILISHLTIGETYFFRDKKLFNFLETNILPGLINMRKNINPYLRIWSAGCSTGEEPYTIAMLLDKLLPDIPDWNITILATDINTRALNKAAAGIYKEWSFRDIPEHIKQKYFRTKTAKSYELTEKIKNMVSFSYLNLASDSYPSLVTNTNAMDIIFCRNVLMYFNKETAEKVISHFYPSLIDNGLLFVSPSEASNGRYKQFSKNLFPGVILFKKAPIQIVEKQDLEIKQLRKKVTEAYAPPKRSLPKTRVKLKLREPKPTKAMELEGKTRDDPGSRFERALKFYSRSNYTEAELILLKLVEEDKNNLEYLLLLVKVCSNKGKLDEAQLWCTRAIELDRVNATAYFLLALILQEKNLPAQAEMNLKKAIYLEPDFILAHFTFGNLTMRSGKLREADNHFNNALDILSKLKKNEILPEADGVTAVELTEIIKSINIRDKDYA